MRQILLSTPLPVRERFSAEGDLQEVFTTVYDRGGYRYLLDYRRPVEPPLKDEDRVWVEDLLAKALQVTP
jgi:hypothetical protein